MMNYKDVGLGQTAVLLYTAGERFKGAPLQTRKLFILQ